MLNSRRIVGLTYMQSIRCCRCGKERGVQLFMGLSLPSKWRRGKSMWVMCGFRFRLCLSFLSSDQIRLGFLCFLLRRSQIGRKITFNYLIFWQISSTFCYALILCAETPFFILKKVLAPITSGECSRGC